MMRKNRRRASPGAAAGFLATLLVTALLCAGAASALGLGASSAVASTPTWRLKSYRHVGYDRSFKADLIDELPGAPGLVVFGGSRAMRFEPSFFTTRTGLGAFNAAVQNCRPEDVWALSSYLFSRAPDVRLDCVFAVQTATFTDAPLHAGLLYDPRLSQFFPADLVAQQKAALGKPSVKQLLGDNHYSARGLLVRNAYDIARTQPGFSFDQHLAEYIRRLLPKYAWHGPVIETRSRAYFEKTMQLFNAHGVVPAIVLMPYHPRALRAFRTAGFQKKVDALLTYLRDAQTRCSFRILNLLSIGTFDGRASWFYDGAHVTTENARQIVRQALRAAPECFR
jgi:hypothetical protein